MTTLIDYLKTNKLTIGLAESMTGGSLSFEFVKHPGVSEVYKGSIVCYQNDMKIKILKVSKDLIKTYGVVSREVAIEMATQAKNVLGADIALSVTGYAENFKDIWIACNYQDKVYVKKLSYKALNRIKIIEKTVNEMIDMCKETLSIDKTHFM
jgi:nicotinamide-nucleotide amidase